MNAGELVTIKRIAELLGTTPRTVRAWIHDKHHPLPYYQPTRKTILIRLPEFEQWLEASRREREPARRQELERMKQARRLKEERT